MDISASADLDRDLKNIMVKLQNSNTKAASPSKEKKKKPYESQFMQNIGKPRQGAVINKATIHDQETSSVERSAKKLKVARSTAKK